MNTIPSMPNARRDRTGRLVLTFSSAYVSPTPDEILGVRILYRSDREKQLLKAHLDIIRDKVYDGYMVDRERQDLLYLLEKFDIKWISSNAWTSWDDSDELYLTQSE